MEKIKSITLYLKNLVKKYNSKKIYDLRNFLN